MHFETKTEHVEGTKEGILLELGFDRVTPYITVDISSWAYEKAILNPKIQIIDNRAKGIACYHPGYTFVEKLQTIATKFRQGQIDGIPRVNMMRQYYDVYNLLENKIVQDFIGTEDYFTYKEERFPKADLEIPIGENQAFLLEDESIRAQYEEQYKSTSKLYYKGQPPFDKLLERIGSALGQL